MNDLTLKSLLLLVLLAVAGCAMRGEVANGVRPMVPDQELAGSELLDVAIGVFASEELTDKERQELGLSEEIRDAEVRYVPTHLKYTMQRTGYWGAVRLVPGENTAHVQVSGTIRRSDGERLVLSVAARDARGVPWFRKDYAEKIGPADYRGSLPEKQDPFQDLYNTIANDLAEYRNRLSADEVREIQRVAELRFARDMSPEAFAGYLNRDRDGRHKVNRLPGEGDPMLERVRAIEVRDGMLIDTINGYYDVYYQDLWLPYTDWRKLYSEEATAMRKVEKEALARQVLGVAAVLGGVLLSTQDSSVARSGLPEVMVIGGAATVYSGFQKRQDVKIHKDVIEELSVSFSSEATPLVVEVMGETVRLTGSAEQQYDQWRRALRDIYAAETGLPLAPLVEEASPEPEVSADDGPSTDR